MGHTDAGEPARDLAESSARAPASVDFFCGGDGGRDGPVVVRGIDSDMELKPFVDVWVCVCVCV